MSFDEYIFDNVFSNRNFAEAIELQDLRENYFSNFVRCLLLKPQTFGAAPKHILVYNLVTSHDLKIQKLQ